MIANQYSMNILYKSVQLNLIGLAGAVLKEHVNTAYVF